jgi:BlaI family penicillinase repressor
VKTLISRLLNKGAIGYDKKGRIYEYRPEVSERECAREERDHFLEKVYQGSFSPMMVSMIEEKRFSKEEIRELKSLLDKIESGP